LNEFTSAERKYLRRQNVIGGRDDALSQKGNRISLQGSPPAVTNGSPSKQTAAGTITFNIRPKKVWYETKAWVERKVEKSVQTRSKVHKSEHYQRVQIVKEF
jgi:hypothetical protein